MMVYNGVKQRPVAPADFDMTSVDPKRIMLPYTGEFWSELCLDALYLVFDKTGYTPPDDEWHFEQIVSDMKMEVNFGIQPRTVHTVAHLHIETVDHIRIDGRIPFQLDDDETDAILDCFFSSGGRGVQQSFLDFFQDRFKSWRGWSKKNRNCLLNSY